MLRQLLFVYFLGFQLFSLFQRLYLLSGGVVVVVVDVCLSLAGTLLVLWMSSSTRTMLKKGILIFPLSMSIYFCFKMCRGHILLSCVVFTPLMLFWLCLFRENDPKEKKEQFVPAMSYHFLSKLYDPIIAWTCREETFKKALMKQVELESKKDILDVGCGTGTLMLHLKLLFPKLHVVGVDADQAILDIAQKKAGQQSMKLELYKALGQKLPFDDQSFDVAVSSLFFHHLRSKDKLDTFKSMFNVLRIGGELHIADWGKPTNRLMRVLFFLVQLLDGFETTQDNVDGVLPLLMQKAGFEDIQTRQTFSTIFGTITLYSAKKKMK